MIVTLCAILVPQLSNASVSLPLDGYCKPGRFFPIAVDAATTFSAAGCMDAQANSRGILPMWVTGTPHELRWAGGTLHLRQPAENERLIAGIGDHFTDAEALFAGKRLIPIKLDPSDLLPGPPMAWDTLDAILLDAAMVDRISDAQRSALLAGGVMLISVGDQAPDTRWPWQHVGSLWTLSFPIAGPSNDVINEDIYTPTYGWTPDLPGTVRARVMGVGMLIVLMAGGLMFLPRKKAGISIIVLCIIATIGIALWRRSLGSVDHIGGDILISHDSLIQRDVYVYERAKESSVETIPFTGWTRPLFASTNGMTQSQMKLTLSATGDLAFTYQATAGHTLAFLRRDVQPGSLPTVTTENQSPMREVAKLEYLCAASKIAGEITGVPGRWTSVVIGANNRTP